MRETSTGIEPQIAEWIREHVVIAETGRGRCRRLVLRHMSLDSHPQGDVTSISLPNDEGLAGEVDMIVNKVVDAAQRDANDFQGTIQKYALFAYYADDPNYVPRKIFRVAADDEITRDLAPSEPPTEKGLAAQAMRHLEAVMKMATMSQTYTTEQLLRRNEKLQDKEERSDQQKIDLMLLFQETTNDFHRRRLDERKADMEQSIKEGVFEQLKVAIPIILNRLAGKPLLPAQDTSFMMMASFLENLRPEQQAYLRDGLEPAQAAALAEILGEYEKKKASFLGSSAKIPEQQLALENALPPSIDGNEISSIPAPDDIPNSLSTMFQNVRERTETPSNDEVIQRIEQHNTNFMSRLSDLNRPPKKD